MPTRKKPPTAEERAARREADRHRMCAAVEALKTSEGWTGWLRARAAFHRYSFRNQVLIAFQCPEATHVAGYRAWQGLGYQVRRGELGIYIWARCAPSKKRLEKWRRGGADPKDEPKAFFRMVPVFDRSQADPIPDHPGGPLPLEPPPSEPIAGDSLAHLFEPLAALAASHGYSVAIVEIVGAAEAFCSHLKKAIGVQPIAEDFSPNRQIARLIHEDAHMLVRTVGFEDDFDFRKGEEEVIVECVASLVCASVGLDIAGSSVPYIAGWGDAEQIERYGEEIDRLARMIEDAIRCEVDPEPPTPAAPRALAVAA